MCHQVVGPRCNIKTDKCFFSLRVEILSEKKHLSARAAVFNQAGNIVASLCKDSKVAEIVSARNPPKFADNA